MAFNLLYIHKNNIVISEQNKNVCPLTPFKHNGV